MTDLEGGTICLITPDERLHLAAQRETSEATVRDLTENIIKIGECLCGECARMYEKILEYAGTLEIKVKERTAKLEAKMAEIERMNRLFVGRELRMVELKERLKALEGKVG